MAMGMNEKFQAYLFYYSCKRNVKRNKADKMTFLISPAINF